MEYTKDIIFKVRYDEVSNTIRLNGRTNSLISKIKRHKILTTGIALAIVFIAIDCILLADFIKILVTL